MDAEWELGRLDCSIDVSECACASFVPDAVPCVLSASATCCSSTGKGTPIDGSSMVCTSRSALFCKAIAVGSGLRLCVLLVFLQD